MRRNLATVLMLVAVAAVSATSPLVGQDSDTTGAREPAARWTAPTFHAGQWAGQFTASGGFYGVGAMRFSRPDKAWLLRARFSGTLNDPDGEDSYAVQESVALSGGPRWFRPGHSRVRPFAGFGMSVNANRSHTVFGANSSKQLSYGASVFGEIGAAVFLAPELSLGMSWSAGIGALHGRFYQNDVLTGRSSSSSVSAGDLELEGAIYF